ncbi:MAG: aminotransferase class I/II-fold pyridoxal phosphate-dependent enzyme [Lentimicrobiaceae bacterium]|nr:aminotransferase class I/II-fold pyridoxal phosphate-dependent enzyme [Lentimicrobiaceae bacterium]
MKINDFKLERYFAKHEFSAKYLLSSSDCDGYEMQYLLELATETELNLWKSIKLGYTESEGNPLLRQSILQHYHLSSIENVMVASPGELNFISMNTLLNPSDHVIAVSPCYQSLYEVVKSINCELSYWKPNPQNWVFDTSDLKSLIKSNTKLIIINFPHNPTGAYLTTQQLNNIVEMARAHNIYIFSDEMYRKLMVGNMPELPAICDIYEKGISLWGTSKSFGLAGLRIGWLVSQDRDFLQKVVSFKDYLSICNSAPSEILSLIALNHIHDLVTPNIEKIKANVILFNHFATKYHEIFSFIPPQAGSTAFVKLNTKGSSLNFSNQLVANTGIMTVPAEMFEYPGSYLRIGFGRRNFAEILQIFDAYLKTI